MTSFGPEDECRDREILVLGSSGMAGHVVSVHLEEQGYQVTKVAGSYRTDLDTIVIDVTDHAELDEVLRRRPYAAVVNCIGLLVKESERRPSRAAYLNAYLPHYLEEFFGAVDTKVIHLSTDCVFAGTSAPYIESAPRDGRTFYDRSKALGEIENEKDITLRMSLIGPELRDSGTGLMHWFLGQSGDVRGYTNVIWNGITTLELAKAIIRLLDSEVAGIYHLVPDYSISKFELLRLIGDVFGRKDINLRPDESLVSDKTLVDTRRELPFVLAQAGYRGMIEELLVWTASHWKLYAGMQRYGRGNLAQVGGVL